MSVQQCQKQFTSNVLHFVMGTIGKCEVLLSDT